MLQECFPLNANGKREIKEKYKEYCEKFSKVTQTIAGDKKVNVRIVHAAKITVCPYCNRDYINSRSKFSAGAQLDHFYPKSLYPFFALSLYNLIPVCGTCNLVKRDNKKIFASPFDSSINWDDEIQFKFPDLEATPGFVEIHAENRAKNNICELKIQEAYQVHEIEIKEIAEKAQAYNASQLDEFKSVLGDNSLTRAEIKRVWIEIKNIEDKYINSKRLKSQKEKIQYAKARIELYVDMNNSGIFESVDEDIKALEGKIQSLEEKINLFHIDNQKERAQTFINNNMNKLSKSLDFEEEYRPINLNFDILEETFDVYQRQKNSDKIYLYEMGSGANWVSCHIALFLSFLRYFATQEQSPMLLTMFFD